MHKFSTAMPPPSSERSEEIIRPGGATRKAGALGVLVGGSRWLTRTERAARRLPVWLESLPSAQFGRASGSPLVRLRAHPDREVKVLFRQMLSGLYPKVTASPKAGWEATEGEPPVRRRTNSIRPHEVGEPAREGRSPNGGSCRKELKRP